jgi:hypothetical protein
MFQSLGNLESDPRAGLLVLDPEHGESLHVTGTAHTVWDATEAAAWPGAERVVVFDLLEARRRPAALPWEAGPGLPSPFTPALTNPHGGEHG